VTIPSFGAHDLEGVHVLAVDDEADALTLVSELLRTAGATVTTARSAAEAMAHLQSAAPHVLLADIGMPQLDGFQFLEQVRQHPNVAVRRVPAAALTAYARSEDRVRALRAGFQMHLAKPIDPAELVATVAALSKRVEPFNDGSESA
jgi:CheY-like chemotaxis protein